MKKVALAPFVSNMIFFPHVSFLSFKLEGLTVQVINIWRYDFSSKFEFDNLTQGQKAKEKFMCSCITATYRNPYMYGETYSCTKHNTKPDYGQNTFASLWLSSCKSLVYFVKENLQFALQL